MSASTAKLPKKGRIGNSPFVPSSSLRQLLTFTNVEGCRDWGAKKRGNKVKVQHTMQAKAGMIACNNLS